MRSLSKGHGLHLLAAHRALCKQLEEIERVAVQGRAPGSGGQALTPLPPDLWQQVGPLLAHIHSLSEAIALRHAPGRLQAAGERQPMSATLRWMSLLLRRMEEALEELEPGSVARKFGDFALPDESDRLEREVATMRADLASAQHALEDWRKNRKPL
jgi:hypothetical protein